MALTDRIVQYPNRYIFEDTNGVQTGPYTLIRDEGNVTEPGTLMSAAELTAGINSIIASVIQSGEISSISVTSGAYVDKSVNFDTPFASVPRVVVGFKSTSTAGAFGRCCCAVSVVSTTGFTVRIFNGDAATRAPNIEWIACEM